MAERSMEAHLLSVCADWLDQVCCWNALQVVPAQYAFVVHTASGSTPLQCVLNGWTKLLLECAAGCASTVCLCGAHSQWKYTS